MKKRTIIISCIGAVAVLAGGTVFGINRYQYSKNVVDVIPVEMLYQDWGFENEGSSGTVTNSMSQEIVPDEEQEVRKIYVKEGQTVKIGDKLLAYDMETKKLELELKGYDVKEIEFSITRAEKELANLKKGIVSDSGSSGSDSSVGRRDPLLASLFLRSSDSQTTGQESTTASSGEGTTATNTEEGTTTTTASEETTTETAEATVYTTLTATSQAYRGEGTSASPYRYLCSSDVKIRGSFINMIRGYNADGSQKIGESIVVILEVRQGNTPSGEVTKSLTLYGDQETKKNESSSWSLDAYADGGDEDDDSTTATTGDEDDDDSSVSFPADSGGDSGSISYTREEINNMITEKENDITELKLDLREAQLEYDTMEKEVKDGTVTAVINGVVKEVRDPEEAASDGSAVITVSSEGNLYVRGAIDEFSYNSLQEGAMITASSWDTGSSFSAKVTEISPYPVTNSNYYYTGTGNPNVSYYPFTAIIEEEPEDISSGESVTITFDQEDQAAVQEETKDGVIYLPLAYVRTENNQSYVYIRGEDNKLEQKFITTGQTLYNYVIEIKSGLKTSDYVAFPYGTTIKDGAKTKIADDESEILY